MSIYSRIKRIWAATWGPEDDRWYFPGGSFYGGLTPTQAGVSVDSNTAMQLMTVHNCVKVLSQSIAQLPLHLMAQNGDMKEKATEHYLYRLLHDQPNSWMTAAEFWGMAVAHISLRGNFYAYKMGIPGRPIIELIPIKADAVQEVIQETDYSLSYKILVPTQKSSSAYGEGAPVGGEFKIIPGNKIMHLRGLVLNGFTGINPIQYARESIGQGMASERFVSRFFGKGMHPGAVFKHPLSLSAPAHKNLKENLQKKYEGLGNSWEFMLIDEAMTVEFPDIKLVDAQFLEIGKFNQSEICGMFRVPLMLVQSGDKAPTYASAEQFMLAFVTHALTPIVVNIEQAIKRDLLTESEKKKYYSKFEMRGLLRGAFKEQTDGLKTLVNTEIINPNEARAVLDMNPYSGGEVYRTRTSTTKETGNVTKQEATKNVMELIRPIALKKDKVDWEKLYKEGDAHWADDLQPSKYAQDFAKKLIDEGRKSILEIGCGNGRDSIFFAIAGLSVSAIDLIPEAVEIAKSNAKKAGVTINFQIGAAEKLQFADNSFDALFTLSVLHSTNIKKSISEIYRVMKKEGIVYIYVYSNVEKIDGTKTDFISVDEYVNLVKETRFKFIDIYTLPEEEYDEAGEKHLIIVSEVRK